MSSSVILWADTEIAGKENGELNMNLENSELDLTDRMIIIGKAIDNL